VNDASYGFGGVAGAGAGLGVAGAAVAGFGGSFAVAALMRLTSSAVMSFSD
jgi:hypothetical protein